MISEFPLHTQIFKQANIFNWTATYRTDSTVVAPYERWQYYNENVKTMTQEKNYAANKTKQVAWFVSNCGARYDSSPIVSRGRVFLQLWFHLGFIANCCAR